MVFLFNTMPKILFKFKEIGFDIDQSDYIEYKSGSSNRQQLLNFFYDCYLLMSVFNAITNFNRLDMSVHCQTSSHCHILEYLLKSNTDTTFNRANLMVYLKRANLVQPSGLVRVDDERIDVVPAVDVNCADYDILTDEQWSCGKCTFLNDPDQRYCVMCKCHKLIDIFCD